jgi:iron-sulfur cluster repair protein YtfE (RIC family)
MMPSQPLTHERFEQIRAEHTEICDLVTTLYRVLAERHEPAPRVVHLLESLLERVAAHLRDEESCGLFRDLRRRLPQHLDTIDTLEQEHQELVRHLSTLHQAASTSDIAPNWWDELEAGFRAFSTQLNRHEFRENDLLQEAYGEDLGDQD